MEVEVVVLRIPAGDKLPLSQFGYVMFKFKLNFYILSSSTMATYSAFFSSGLLAPHSTSNFSYYDDPTPLPSSPLPIPDDSDIEIDIDTDSEHTPTPNLPLVQP